MATLSLRRYDVRNWRRRRPRSATDDGTSVTRTRWVSLGPRCPARSGFVTAPLARCIVPRLLPGRTRIPAGASLRGHPGGFSLWASEPNAVDWHIAEPEAYQLFASAGRRSRIT